MPNIATLILGLPLWMRRGPAHLIVEFKGNSPKTPGAVEGT